MLAESEELIKKQKIDEIKSGNHQFLQLVNSIHEQFNGKENGINTFIDETNIISAAQEKFLLVLIKNNMGKYNQIFRDNIIMSDAYKIAYQSLHTIYDKHRGNIVVTLIRTRCAACGQRITASDILLDPQPIDDIEDVPCFFPELDLSVSMESI